MIECHLKNESCGFQCTGYDGTEVWKKLHSIHKEVECESCSEHTKSLMSGVHDAVNIGLGKDPFDAVNFSRFAEEIACAYNRCKKDGKC